MSAERPIPADGPVAAAADPGSALLVPGWLRRMTALGWRVVASVAFAVVLAEVALTVSTATLAVLVGAVVGATFLPVVRYLRVDRSWPAGRAAALTSVLALVSVLLIVLLIILAFVPYVGAIVQAAHDGVEVVVRRLADLGLPPAVLEYVERLANGIQGWVTDAGRQLVGPIGTVVTVLILGGFMTFYLLADADRAWARATDHLDGWRADTLTGRAVMALDEVSGYLRGTTVTAVTSAVTQTAYLVLLGVPLAGPLGVLVFLGGFVPYVGAFFTTVALLVVTFAARGGPSALILLALISATALVQRRLVARYVYGRARRIQPAVILIVVPAGAALFGLGGLFLAVPIVATVLAFGPAIVAVLGDDPAASTTAAFSPLWLDRLAQWSWRGLVLIASGVVAIQVLVVPFLSAPVVVALIVACAMHPGWSALIRRGWGPTAAALLITLVSGAVIAAILVVTFVSVAQQLPDILRAAADGADDLGLGTSPADVIGTIGPTLESSAGSIVANVASVTVALVIAGLLTFFFLRDGGGWWTSALSRVPARQRTVIGESGAKAARIVNGSTLGTGLISVVAGTLQFLMMTVLGLPLAFPIGVLTFFAGFIPYVGGFIATGLAFLIAIAGGNPTTIVLMAIFTIVINITIGNFVAPLVLGRTVKVHPAIVLLAAPVGAAIGGLIGMFLIVPVIAIVIATWRPVIHLFDPGDEDRPVASPPSPAQVAASAETRSVPAPATG